MSCADRAIVGAFARKIKVVEIPVFVPDSSTAYTAGDALTDSWQELSDVFDDPNGNAELIEVSVQYWNGTSLTKKGINFIFFRSKPASSVVSANVAEGLTSADSDLVCGTCAVVTADYVDANSKLTVARTKTNLPVVNNNSLTATRSLWVKPLATEAQTYAAAGRMTIRFVFEQF